MVRRGTVLGVVLLVGLMVATGSERLNAAPPWEGWSSPPWDNWFDGPLSSWGFPGRRDNAWGGRPWGGGYDEDSWGSGYQSPYRGNGYYGDYSPPGRGAWDGADPWRYGDRGYGRGSKGGYGEDWGRPNYGYGEPPSADYRGYNNGPPAGNDRGADYGRDNYGRGDYSRDDYGPGDYGRGDYGRETPPRERGNAAQPSYPPPATGYGENPWDGPKSENQSGNSERFSGDNSGSTAGQPWGTNPSNPSTKNNRTDPWGSSQ